MCKACQKPKDAPQPHRPEDPKLGLYVIYVCLAIVATCILSLIGTNVISLN